MKTPIHFLCGVAIIAMVSLVCNSCSQRDHPEPVIKGKLKPAKELSLLNNAGRATLALCSG